jgi:hypothetical protein
MLRKLKLRNNVESKLRTKKKDGINLAEVRVNKSKRLPRRKNQRLLALSTDLCSEREVKLVVLLNSHPEAEVRML